MMLLIGDRQRLTLELDNIHKTDFVDWLEQQPRRLSADEAGWQKQLFWMSLAYGEPNEAGELQTQRERVTVRVAALGRDRIEVEIVCRASATLPRLFLKRIAHHWPETRQSISQF